VLQVTSSEIETIRLYSCHPLVGQAFHWQCSPGRPAQYMQHLPAPISSPAGPKQRTPHQEGTASLLFSRSLVGQAPSVAVFHARLSCQPNTSRIFQRRSAAQQAPSRGLPTKESLLALVSSSALVGQALSVAVLPKTLCHPGPIIAPSSSIDHQPCRPQAELPQQPSPF
jgi:hypothetical protein